MALYVQVNDRVKRSDVTERSIPAFKAARGRVVEVQDTLVGVRARIWWDGDPSPEYGFRDASTICLDEPGQSLENG